MLYSNVIIILVISFAHITWSIGLLNRFYSLANNRECRRELWCKHLLCRFFNAIVKSVDKFLKYFFQSTDIQNTSFGERGCELFPRYNFKFSSIGNPIVSNHFLGQVTFLQWSGLSRYYYYRYVVHFWSYSHSVQLQCLWNTFFLKLTYILLCIYSTNIIQQFLKQARTSEVKTNLS